MYTFQLHESGLTCIALYFVTCCKGLKAEQVIHKRYCSLTTEASLFKAGANRMEQSLAKRAQPSQPFSLKIDVQRDTVVS